MKYAANWFVFGLLIFSSGCSQEKTTMRLTEKYGVDGKKATIILNNTSGRLVVPESLGRRAVDLQIFDVKIAEFNGVKLITMRLDKLDAAPLSFSGALAGYGCGQCETYGLQIEWIAQPN